VNAITGVIGFGGGSSLDVAKLVALLCGSGEDIESAWGVGNAKGPRLPLVLVPTTAGTGSEVTPVSIITIGGEEKRGVSSPILLPDIAVLDADLTLGLPPDITAATGIDAMVHAIEAFSSKHANNNPLSRMLAKSALQLLGANIERAVNIGHDRTARGAMLLGSMLAGQAFANSPVAAVHALAYPIGGSFHVPHGLSNALVLPHVLRFNAPVAATTYASIAVDAFPHLVSVSGEEERCAAFIEHLSDLSARLGLQRRLRDVGIQQEDVAGLARNAMRQTRLLVNNPRDIGETDALEIYRAAW
jgi:alcohol dehydrogenase class IV